MNAEDLLRVLKEEKECSLERRYLCTRICKSCVYRNNDEILKEFWDKIENMLSEEVSNK